MSEVKNNIYCELDKIDFENNDSYLTDENYESTQIYLELNGIFTSDYITQNMTLFDDKTKSYFKKTVSYDYDLEKSEKELSKVLNDKKSIITEDVCLNNNKVKSLSLKFNLRDCEDINSRNVKESLSTNEKQKDLDKKIRISVIKKDFNLLNSHTYKVENVTQKNNLNFKVKEIKLLNKKNNENETEFENNQSINSIDVKYNEAKARTIKVDPILNRGLKLSNINDLYASAENEEKEKTSMTVETKDFNALKSKLNETKDIKLKIESKVKSREIKLIEKNKETREKSFEFEHSQKIKSINTKYEEIKLEGYKFDKFNYKAIEPKEVKNLFKLVENKEKEKTSLTVKTKDFNTLKSKLDETKNIKLKTEFNVKLREIKLVEEDKETKEKNFEFEHSQKIKLINTKYEEIKLEGCKFDKFNYKAIEPKEVKNLFKLVENKEKEKTSLTVETKDFNTLRSKLDETKNIKLKTEFNIKFREIKLVEEDKETKEKTFEFEHSQKIKSINTKYEEIKLEGYKFDKFNYKAIEPKEVKDLFKLVENKEKEKTSLTVKTKDFNILKSKLDETENIKLETEFKVKSREIKLDENEKNILERLNELNIKKRIKVIDVKEVDLKRIENIKLKGLDNILISNVNLPKFPKY